MIYNREKNILVFKQFSEYLKANVLTKNVLQDIIETIKEYRDNSLTIVKMFHKIREMSSFYMEIKKYNVRELQMTFNFDQNYLVKVISY